MTWLMVVVALSASGLKTGVRYFTTEQQCKTMVQEASAAVQFNGNWRCIRLDPNTPIERFDTVTRQWITAGAR